MNKLLLLLFSILILPVSVNASDVYYCSDAKQMGFRPDDNFSSNDYKGRKFKIMIDFENKRVSSQEIWMGENSVKRCIFENNVQTLYCISDFGTAFSINKKNNFFIRSEIYNQVNQNDDITLAYGTCEKY